MVALLILKAEGSACRSQTNLSADKYQFRRPSTGGSTKICLFYFASNTERNQKPLERKNERSAGVGMVVVLMVVLSDILCHPNGAIGPFDLSTSPISIIDLECSTWCVQVHL